MTQYHHIKEAEHGVVRVFVLSRPSDLKRGAPLPIEQIATWLGVGALNVADVQQIWTDDMVEMPLEELLMNGYGVSAEEIAPHIEHFNATMDLHPTIFVVVRSAAFLHKPLTLSMEGPLFLLASLHEPDGNVSFEPLPNSVMEDAPQKKRPSDAAISGRVAMVALLVMAVLVWLMIRIAG